MANSFHTAGRRREALKLREAALKLFQKVLGKEHPRTIGAMLDLAISYHDVGKLDDALSLQSLQWKEANQDALQKDVELQRFYAEAEQLMKRAAVPKDGQPDAGIIEHENK